LLASRKSINRINIGQVGVIWFKIPIEIERYFQKIYFIILLRNSLTNKIFSNYFGYQGEAMPTITLDGEQVTVREGATIIEAAEAINLKIPHLCYFKGLSPDGSCGICIVEIEGERGVSRSCVRQVEDGMKIHSNPHK
jgi:ferredoxin